MSDVSRRIASSFRDPRALVAALGLERAAKRLGRGGIQVLCPWHNEKSPSCAVSVGRDGSVFVKCFGCDRSGDALGLIAAAKQLDVKSQYREVLEVACELGGLHDALAELRGEHAPSEPREQVETLPMPIARAYPPQDELLGFWATCLGVTWDNAATGLLRGRGIDPERVERLDLARTPPDAVPLPAWATYQGRSWLDTGHRMVLPVYDSDGHMRSVRAWRVTDGESPKRLPPAGYRASELVLANGVGLCMLRGEPVPGNVVLVEGEPDWMTRSMINQDIAVIGIGSGSWSPAFAQRVPYGSQVLVRTHRDRAGDGYALKVLESVRGRAQVYRLSIEQDTEAA
jgi:CHC2-type zinc finger protein